jgi:hypothetical protein
MLEQMPAELNDLLQRVMCLIDLGEIRGKLAEHRVLLTNGTDLVEGYRIACGGECSAWGYAPPKGSLLLQTAKLATQMQPEALAGLIDSLWPQARQMSGFEYAFRQRARATAPAECDRAVQWLSAPIEFKLRDIMATHKREHAPDPVEEQGSVLVQPKFELVRDGLSPLVIETRVAKEFEQWIELDWLAANSPHFADLQQRLAVAWPEVLVSKKEAIDRRIEKLISKGKDDFAQTFVKVVEQHWPKGMKLPEPEDLARLMTVAHQDYNERRWSWDKLRMGYGWDQNNRAASNALYEMTKVVARHEHKGKGIALAAIPLLQIYTMMAE